MKIILASASPRRKQILNDAGFEFTTMHLDADETYPESMDVEQVPVFIASKKMHHAKQRINKNDAIIITADTVVILNDKIIGKPENANDAENILHALSGNMHKVITAVCISYKDIEVCLDALTKVYFAPLTNSEIIQYIEKYKPFDKAGAYAIQEWIGVNKILSIDGDYYNVVGFPMSKVYPYLHEILSKESN